MMTNVRDLFDLPDSICFLNAAYMGPMPKAAVGAAANASQAKCQPWTVGIPEFFNPIKRARQGAARLFGVTAENIAIVPSASYGLAIAALNISLAPGKEILVLDEQFPSNVYVWRDLARKHDATIKVVKRAEGQGWTEAILGAVGPLTGLLACAQTHWIDGGFVDLEIVSEKLRAHGGELVLDISQSCGVQPIDLGRICPAFAVSAGYKWLLGPYALAYLYVRPDKQNGQPFEHGWINRKGSENFARLIDYTDEYNDGAERFDMGERSNFQLAPQAQPGLDLLGELQPQNIAIQLAEHTQQIAELCAPLGMTADPRELRSGHYLGMQLPSDAPQDLLARLVQENVFVSQRGSRLRVTPHVYTTQADIERFVSVLGRVLQ